ncbi:hypothetical protein L3X38_028084 [Prunus dulcis]|uniref:Uncharacterized protein n=2 Tax=Prunus dulcis TaxID=3755 RepID=A0AAD4Z037_PRUDU|nr:hypothetical protein L3X38_028084 [Prunus dulcis]
MMRPSMSRVVAILSGDIEASTVMSKPSYSADWDFKDVTTRQVAFWWMMIPHQLRAMFSSTISLKGAQPVLAPGLTLPVSGKCDWINAHWHYRRRNVRNKKFPLSYYLV